ANNVRVTLSYLLRVLEPWRADHEPSYFVRVDGSEFRVTLTADAEEFDGHIAEATAAERAGSVSVALGHHLAAAEMYRGDLYADLPEQPWFALERERYRSRFRTTALRAAEL